MPNEKLLRALGLCAKARALVFGTDAVCEALRAGKPFSVIMASDNSENTAKKLRDKCSFYNIPMTVSDADGATLGHAVGKAGKISAVAVTDRNLADLVEGSKG